MTVDDLITACERIRRKSRGYTLARQRDHLDGPDVAAFAEEVEILLGEVVSTLKEGTQHGPSYGGDRSARGDEPS